MYQEKLPMLTKGPFALFYGGEEILTELSDKSPGRGVPLLIVWSAILQVSLYILKSARSRNKMMYFHNLTKSLVENVLNMYGIIVIILISIISTAYITIHHLSIEKNRMQDTTPKIIPKEILILYFLTMFCVVLPFIKSYALR